MEIDFSYMLPKRYCSTTICLASGQQRELVTKFVIKTAVHVNAHGL